MYRREDQYRSAQQQMWSTQRARRRSALRRRRWLALLTVLVGIIVGVAAQAGVSLPPFMPSNESLAKGSSPDGTANVPSLTVARALAAPIRTVTRLPDPAGGSVQEVLRLP